MEFPGEPGKFRGTGKCEVSEAAIRWGQLVARALPDYYGHVYFRSGPICVGVFLVLWLGGIYPSGIAADKSINLRNERIRTALSFQAAADRNGQPIPPRLLSGLILIQFTAEPSPSWTDIVKSLGVKLLRYVPEDAFIARAAQARLDEIGRLPFVQWVGPYRPDHKVHPSLQPHLSAPANLIEKPVTLLLSPEATDADVARARAGLRKVTQESRHRFGAVLHGTVTQGALAQLADSPSILWIEPDEGMKLYDGASTGIVAGLATNGAISVHQLGYDGRRVRVAVADSGLHLGNTNAMHPDLAGRVTRLLAYGTLPSAVDQHGHGTHVTGIIAGNGARGTRDDEGYLYGLGVAPAASIVVQRIFDGAANYFPPPSFERLTRDAQESGAIVGANSWGRDNQARYDADAAEFDALTRDANYSLDGDQPYLLVFSTGNAGPAPQTISSPAVAKNVIAVGASQSDRSSFATYSRGREAMADFSSRGPCEDGRTKPDLVAPGTWIASLRSPVGNSDNSWLGIDADYAYMGGTSQAAPHVAGAAALFIQYFRATFGNTNPSPALVKAALIHAAVALNESVGTGQTPNMAEGWGRLELTTLIPESYRHEYLDQSVTLQTGEQYERPLILSSTNKPLKVTLAYTDVPGFPGAVPALVNDLDLELVAPDGRLYLGNQFQQGESIPDPDPESRDTLNNVEGIRLQAPLPGVYRVRVRARNVVQDARRDTDPVDQDFALVISGDIAPPGEGIVLLDRHTYSAPSLIAIRLIDTTPNLPATVTVRSATEPAGLAVNLTLADGAGVFTGAVATATGAAGAAARLEITDGDWIRVEYRDTSDHTNVATATADLRPPAMVGLNVRTEFGLTVVLWQTLEPATSVVRYGTNPNNLTLEASNAQLTTLHKLQLSGLVAGRTYYFAVSSTDEAGNSATNNPADVPFVAPQAATVLLVDAYTYTFPDTFIELSTYTDALGRAGVTYDVWSTANQGMPADENLSPYQIVIWRLNDSLHCTTDTLPPAQQTAIAQYLNNGGAVFLASMQILSRLLDQGSYDFVTNVLHVKRFVRTPSSGSACLECDEDFQVPIAAGLTNDPLGNGLELTLDYSSYPEIFPQAGTSDLGDTFGPQTNASPFLVESISGKACGLRFPRPAEESAGRVVFVSFPLDAIPEFAPGFNNRSEFLRRVLQFLKPGLNGAGSIAFNRREFKLPDLIAIEVADADLVGQSEITIQVSSSSVPGSVPVELHATDQAAIFRGAVPLFSAALPGLPGQLRATNGDRLVALYNDVSSAAQLQATAIVDGDAPTISNLKVAAGYSDATISWQTDEPTDGLVQFGESIFLGRTAYAADLSTNHSITFSSLAPDRAYFYKVVSRDPSGNASEADNGGLLYTFDTLGPVAAPYDTDFESASGARWKVISAPGSESHWELGPPNNNKVSSAHSLLNAWASNIQGDEASHIDTSLVSPALDLTSGTVVGLRFWQAYSFASGPSLDEVGRLFIQTNPVSPPILLAEYRGSTVDWQQEEIDLTPFIAPAVFLIWQHQLQAFQSDSRPGWAIDDVAITAEELRPGSIQVTNNLAQGKAAVTGHVARLAQGYFTNFSNLPPGRYTATWTPVPYYLTPAAQTNVLGEGGLLRFTGNYSFPDVNNNGMSDLWETAFFNEISPTRTCRTDTDQDGFTDYAEFIAGTNPTQVNSSLRLVTPQILADNQEVRLEWPTVPGRIYLLQQSTNLQTWIPIGDWTQAAGPTLTRTLPRPPALSAFRVSVRP